MAGVTLAAVLAMWLLRRQKGAEQVNEENGAYGYSDKFFHMLAFSGARVQFAAAWLDEWLFAGKINGTPDRPPIFVTSLARGGTTALLNAFHDMPGIATHEYSDMPFITAPIIWSRVSGGTKRRVVQRMRAHGDGLTIDLHSPEAFDEVYWRLFWPEHYTSSVIRLWQTSDVNPVAEKFFRLQFRKIAFLRRRNRQQQAANRVRYLSKNNANIARLRLLPKMFPNCDVVIALRRPAAHAASLLRQHRNFNRLHATDEFSLRYMRDIGHFEFGMLHHPINFDAFNATAHDTDSADYWLAYWIAAFEEVLAHADGCHIVTQDDLRSRPQATMKALAAVLELDVNAMDFTTYFRADADKHSTEMYSIDLLREAEALYNTLARRAITGRLH
jgi:hypothetical protein